MDYDILFTPFKIGKMEVKNRLVMSPMGTYTVNPDGTLSEDTISYYEERAKGGVGMIILGAQFLNEEIAQGSLGGILDDPRVIPPLTECCEVIQRYGAKAVCQISPGTGRNAMPNQYGDPPMSASAIPSTFDPEVLCKPMTIEDIGKVMEDFEKAATIAQNAGFDAIEIHGHAGYLIDQFMSPIWNKREDEYGRTAEGRARFPREIIRSIRKVVGKDMPILFRISLDHRFNGGRTLEDSMELIKFLEEEGVDALDVDAGSYETIDYIFPTTYVGEACMEYVCEPARKAVKTPLLNSGNHTPETAMKLIESGNADFVMMGRQFIADPYTPKKLKERRREDVRPCIRCNQDCIGRIFTRLTKISCAVNPRAGLEDRFTIESTNSPKQVIVIGGGPAGLEAARVAAIAGHKVTLCEKENHIGGQLAAAATPQFKDPLRKLIGWYQVQLKKLDVDVRLGKEITSKDRELQKTDFIIVATGAVPMDPPISGIDRKNVINVIEAHKNKDLVKGQNIVMCGGGLSGCDSALELAIEQGKNVTIVERMNTIAKDELLINRVSLLSKLDEARVKTYTNCKVTSIDDRGVHIEKKDGSTDIIPADTIITSFGMKSNDKQAKEIKERYHIKTRVVGDCEVVGRVGTAIRMGYFAGSTLD